LGHFGESFKVKETIIQYESNSGFKYTQNAKNRGQGFVDLQIVPAMALAQKG
jgi:hypothetical protein